MPLSPKEAISELRREKLSQLPAMSLPKGYPRLSSNHWMKSFGSATLCCDAKALGSLAVSSTDFD